MNLLVPGGAGYIGSHMAKLAKKDGHDVTILDDFSTGNKWAIKGFDTIEVDLLDKYKLKKKLHGRHYDGVIHFAAKSLVGESINDPILYFKNNVIGTLNLIDVMHDNNINNLVFSSSAAIFGNPEKNKIDEQHSKKPINPYGTSKLIVENMLKDICKLKGLNAVCFRYFNAAGADKDAQIGEARRIETHLIPNILTSYINNSTKFKIFGDDYSTFDGTCIRDYVHVNDLCIAHIKGLNYLKKKSGFASFNLGNGNGFSVLEVLKVCEEVVGKKIEYEVLDRRPGDPDILVADSSLARTKLDWNPKYKDLHSIISSAWKWHLNYNKY